MIGAFGTQGSVGVYTVFCRTLSGFTVLVEGFVYNEFFVPRPLHVAPLLGCIFFVCFMTRILQ